MNRIAVLFPAALIAFAASASQAAGLMSPCVPDRSNYLCVLQMPPGQQAPYLGALDAAAVADVEAARKAALEHWFHERGVLAEESFHVAALFRLGEDITAVGARDEWVWEVRVMHLSGALNGIVWVNAHSKAAFSTGPTRRRVAPGTPSRIPTAATQ